MAKQSIIDKEKAEYLKNELRSYNMLKKWVENDSYIFDDRIRYYEIKIKDIEMRLKDILSNCEVVENE